MSTTTVLETPGVSGTMYGSEAPQENGKRRKLYGRAFYESIGSPKLVLAPMVEQSEFVCLIASSLSPHPRPRANGVVSTGMAAAFAFLPSFRPAGLSLSLHADVPFEDVR